MHLNGSVEYLDQTRPEERNVIREANTIGAESRAMRADANRLIRKCQRLDALVKVAARFTYEEIAGMTVADLINRERINLTQD